MSSSSSSSPPRRKCQRVSLEEIEDATENFDERYVVGQGGEAKVYLAQIILARNKITQVAVKHLKSNSSRFEDEIQIMPKIQHPNIVSLLGYCNDSGKKILIYEYMAYGSLADYVQRKNRKPPPTSSTTTSTIYLPWQRRLKICLGAALGLKHLHAETKEFAKGIVHRDVKPDNILLDANWVAKISDFGMFKLSRADQSDSAMPTMLKGTGGYYAPEYLKYQHVTRTIDVYAFGVVLFQVLCRKMPWDRGDESYYGMEDEDLGHWARQNVDSEIQGEISDYCLNAFTQIIQKSLNVNPKKRPTMNEVVLNLQNVLKCQEREDEAKIPEAAREAEGSRASAENCGRQVGGAVCPSGLCCSQYGWCGDNPAHCGPGCQSQCNRPDPTPISRGDGAISDLIPRLTFDRMLLHRNDDACPSKGFYSYDAFIVAANAFKGFATTGDNNIRKREIAAFFAQTSHVTTGGWPTAPDGQYSWGYYYIREQGNPPDYCVPNSQWPCAPGRKYYGRGPIQISYNFNYGPAGKAIGVDLLNNPDQVATDAVISFKTAIWFWMTPQPPKPSCHAVITGGWTPSGADSAAGRNVEFGTITNIISGVLECGHRSDARVNDRIGFYKRYCDILGVSYGDNLDCANQRPFGQGFMVDSHILPVTSN